MRKETLGALLGTLVAGGSVSYQIAHREPLSMDELHSVLLGRLMVVGDVPSFYVGSLTRYEGGAYWVGFPVAFFQKLGAWGTAASSWTAASIALMTLALSALWLGRLRGAGAALGLGVGAAFLAPELIHYSYRAWGSLAEALLLLPVLGLVGSHWRQRGWPSWGPPIFGLLLGLGVIFSYWHMLTSLAVAAALMLERPELPLRRRLRPVLIAGAIALSVFGAWVVVAIPHWGEGAMIRDGLLLHETLPRLVGVRLDQILIDFPGAWVGQHLERSPLRLAAGVGLTALSFGGAWVAWRRGGELRWLSLLFVTALPGLSVGQRILDPPEVYRYYLPVLAISLALIAAWDRRALALALLLAVPMWLPSGLVMPGQDIARSHLELGGNAMHRYSEDPHIKYRRLQSVIRPQYQAWFAFGYGFDSGERYRPMRASMMAGLLETQVDPEEVADNPHFGLLKAAAWLPQKLPDVERNAFLLGMGAGLVADGALEPIDEEFIGALSPADARFVRMGLRASRTSGTDRRVLLEAAGRSRDLFGEMLDVRLVSTPMPKEAGEID